MEMQWKAHSTDNKNNYCYLKENYIEFFTNYLDVFYFRRIEFGRRRLIHVRLVPRCWWFTWILSKFLNWKRENFFLSLGTIRSLACNIRIHDWHRLFHCIIFLKLLSDAIIICPWLLNKRWLKFKQQEKKTVFCYLYLLLSYTPSVVTYNIILLQLILLWSYQYEIWRSYSYNF